MQCAAARVLSNSKRHEERERISLNRKAKLPNTQEKIDTMEEE